MPVTGFWSLQQATPSSKICHVTRSGGDAEEAKAPLDFKLMLLCVQAVTAEGRRKFILEGKKPEVIVSVTHTKIQS